MKYFLHWFLLLLTIPLSTVLCAGSVYAAEEAVVSSEAESAEDNDVVIDTELEPARINEEFPLDSPFYSDRYVARWARAVGLKPMLLAHWKIDEQLARVRKYFTKSGYDDFVSDLEVSGMKKSIIENKLVVVYSTRDSSKLLYSGVRDGRYTWIVKIPAKFQYSSSKSHYSIDMDVTLEVVRSNEPDLDMAIAINKWVAVPVEKNN